MSKGAYIGVDGIARKIKKGYVGVNGTARKIKKAYIGIGGLARPFWSGGELAYWGTATDLSRVKHSLDGASVGRYALFAGGLWNGYHSAVDAYDTSLTKSTPTALSEAKDGLVGASNGNYALFAGGIAKMRYLTSQPLTLTIQV